jgi:hypothetical protein
MSKSRIAIELIRANGASLPEPGKNRSKWVKFDIRDSEDMRLFLWAIPGNHLSSVNIVSPEAYKLWQLIVND